MSAGADFPLIESTRPRPEGMAKFPYDQWPSEPVGNCCIGDAYFLPVYGTFLQSLRRGAHCCIGGLVIAGTCK
jgi:hypothetical protein